MIEIHRMFQKVAPFDHFLIQISVTAAYTKFNTFQSELYRIGRIE